MRNYFTLYNLEALMRQIFTTALLVGAVVFMSGVIFGWWYALLLAIVILLALSLIGMARQ